MGLFGRLNNRANGIPTTENCVVLNRIKSETGLEETEKQLIIKYAIVQYVRTIMFDEDTFICSDTLVSSFESPMVINNISKTLFVSPFTVNDDISTKVKTAISFILLGLCDKYVKDSCFSLYGNKKIDLEDSVLMALFDYIIFGNKDSSRNRVVLLSDSEKMHWLVHYNRIKRFISCDDEITYDEINFYYEDGKRFIKKFGKACRDDGYLFEYRPITSFHERDAHCPNCGSTIKFLQYRDICNNSDYELVENIINGDLFSIRCSFCNSSFPVDYDVRYVDEKRDYNIRVLHNEYSKNTQIGIRIQSELCGYEHSRVVRYIHELQEKVICIEHELDDRIIELYKVYLTEQLRIRFPDKTTKEISLFVKNEKIFLKCFMDHGNPIDCLFMYNIYLELFDIYIDVIDQSDYSQYQAIDKKWAVDFINDNGISSLL